MIKNKLSFSTNFFFLKVLFFKHVSKDLIKSLEDENVDKKISFDFPTSKNQKISNEISRSEHNEMVLKNCPEAIFKDVLKILKTETLKKRVKNYEISGLPGLAKVLHTTNASFKHDLERLQSIFLVFNLYHLTTKIFFFSLKWN
jgi:hypothetical protein